MSWTVRIRHTDASTESIPLASATKTEQFGKIDQARLSVKRGDLNSISVSEAEDWAYLENPSGTDIFGGILKDIVRSGEDPKLVVNSWEQMAVDAEPTPAGQTVSGQDNNIISTAISNTPNITSGTLSNISSNLSFLFDSVSQARKMRKVETVTTGELKFWPDQTVDYVASLGSDKTSDVTGYSALSPSNQNVVGTPEVLKDGSGERVTHLRLRGAGEGTHTHTAEVTASSYSTGDREIWRTYKAEELQRQASVTERANTLIQELNDSYTEISAILKGVDVALGDRWTYEHPEENITSTDLRVVKLKTYIDEGGKRYEAVLSNRQKSRGLDEEKSDTRLDKLGASVQGAAVPINASGGRQPMDSSHNYRMKLYYPAEVEYEHRLNIRVIGLPYRSYSDAKGHNHDVSVTHPTHSHDVTHPSHDHSVTVTHPSHSHTVTHPSHDHSVSVYHPSHTHDVTHPSHDHNVTHPSHTHDVTHPTHDHSFSVNHPSHTHNVTHPTHDHSVNATSTNNTQSNTTVTASGSGYATADYDVWVTVGSQTFNSPTSELYLYTGSWAADEKTQDTRFRIKNTSTGTVHHTTQFYDMPVSQDNLLYLFLTAPTDVNGDTIELQAQNDSGFGDVEAFNEWIGIGKHSHDISSTSDTALGTTETSTTALGTTESTTSDSALGTTETSTSELGTTETSTTALGTTETSTSALGTTSTDTSTNALGSNETSTTALGTNETSTSSTELGTNETSTTALGTNETSTSDSATDLAPGIQEWDGVENSPAYFPKNVDVIVNGTSQGTSYGDGTSSFEQALDVSGVLNAGQMNTVELSTEKLSHAIVYVEGDVFRQILGGG